MEPRRTHRRRLRAQPLIHLVPNIFTVMSLCFGLTSIRYALDHRYELAVTLILLAALFDGLDGSAARLLKITSRLGAELDSLADFLSFGVAPAILLYLWSLNQVRGIGWVFALLFATCCALRLARFNSEIDDGTKPAWMARFFTGMPAPAGAGCVLLPMLVSFAFAATWPRLWPVTALTMLFVSMMMVSRVPTFSVKMVVLRVQPEWILPTLALVGMFVAAVVSAPWLTLLVIGLLYVASLPLGVLAARRARLRHEQAAAESEAGAQAPDKDRRLVSVVGSKRPHDPPTSPRG
jgi:CDP-diacylglycerol---serine O-phosphatidyltransferase